MTNKACIVLQENQGVTPWDDSVGPQLRSTLNSIIDTLAENFEDVKMSLQGDTRYDAVHLLTDHACTRSNLLDKLITETQNGRVIDLFVLGHGSTEKLDLNNGPNLTGRQNGTIRSLLSDAQERGCNSFNLRLVYMCNCYASTVSDDWLAIGAKTAVGSKQRDMMPEPMTTLFTHYWLNGSKVKEAAKTAYNNTKPFYTIPYPPVVKPKFKTITVSTPFGSHKLTVPDGVSVTENPNIKETELKVAGNGNLKF